MRILLWIGVILICGSGTYLGYNLMQDLNQRVAERQTSRDMMRSTIIRMLKNHPLYSFHQVVIGPGNRDDELAFRARVTRTGATQSAYGVVSSRCPDEVSEANSALDVGADARPARDVTCWEVSSLYIDGVPVEDVAFELTPADPVDPVDLATPEASAGAASETSGGETSGGETSGGETGNSETTNGEAPGIPPTAPPIPIPQPPTVAIAPTEDAPVPDVPAPATSEPSLRPSHTVRLSTVNARAAPNGRIETRLSEGTPLLMLEQSGGWGFFRVLDGPGANLEVWVAFSVLEAI